ncbi:MAG: Na+/H+ antiporter subunit E [Methanocorpusculum sp.]|nr:Na+/H+ antiporter subunit E [Methanocorpusculum sp.]
MSNVASAALAAAAAFIVYLVLSAGSAGDTASVLLWSVPELVIGLLLALLVGFLCRKFVPASAARMFNPLRWLLLIVYLVPFIFELAVANLKVAWSIISGKNIRPAVRKVEAPMKTNLGMLLLSASLTYQPGTFTVDVDEEDKSLYVHFLDAGHKPEKTVEPKKIFSFINLAAWIRRICE